MQYLASSIHVCFARMKIYVHNVKCTYSSVVGIIVNKSSTPLFIIHTKLQYVVTRIRKNRRYLAFLNHIDHCIVVTCMFFYTLQYVWPIQQKTQK